MIELSAQFVNVTEINEIENIINKVSKLSDEDSRSFLDFVNLRTFCKETIKRYVASITSKNKCD